MNPDPASASPPRPASFKAASTLTLGASDAPRVRLAVRRVVSGFASCLMDLRARPLPADLGGPCLVIAPHPDDEAFGCGGTMAVLARRGTSVHVAFVTDGGGSHPGHPLVSPAALVALRAAEARAVAQILGVPDGRLHFIGAKDGSLARLEGAALEGVVETLASILTSVKPKVVMLPCRTDGSSEHDAAFRIACLAFQRSGCKPRILEFPIWSRWNPLILLRSLSSYGRVWFSPVAAARGEKARAVACYRSQALPLAPDTRAVLPPGFTPLFLGSREYFLERSDAPQPSNPRQ